MYMDIKTHFGSNIKRLRKWLWLSQEEFANSVKLHRTYISDIERWRKNLSLENIEKIALWLWVDIEVLFYKK